jgi:hypothetical protein
MWELLLLAAAGAALYSFPELEYVSASGCHYAFGWPLPWLKLSTAAPFGRLVTGLRLSVPAFTVALLCAFVSIAATIWATKFVERRGTRWKHIIRAGLSVVIPWTLATFTIAVMPVCWSALCPFLSLASQRRGYAAVVVLAPCAAPLLALCVVAVSIWFQRPSKDRLWIDLTSRFALAAVLAVHLQVVYINPGSDMSRQWVEAIDREVQ